MDDDRGGFDALQVADQVETSQTIPYRLLHSSDDSEGCEVAGFARIRKITCEAELESALAIRARILLPQPRPCQLFPRLLDLRCLLPAIELCLECSPVFERQRRRTHEGESGGRHQMGILPLLYRIKEREQGAPRITEDRKRLEAEFGDDRSEVLDMGAP